MERSKQDRNSSIYFASNINVGNSMMTNSVGNTLIKGSNFNIGTNTALVAAGGGNLLSNALGSFTVTELTPFFKQPIPLKSMSGIIHNF